MRNKINRNKEGNILSLNNEPIFDVSGEDVKKKGFIKMYPICLFDFADGGIIQTEDLLNKGEYVSVFQ